MRDYEKFIFIFIFPLLQCENVQAFSTEGEKIVCVPEIKTFSSNNRYYYYRCGNPGEFAKIVKCPENQFYWAEKQKCIPETKISHSRSKRSTTTSTNANEKPVIEDREILGQVVLGLGDLYDAKQDRFLAGTSLWSEKTINSSKRWQNQLSSNIKYSAGKTLYEKMNEMKVSASLKLSFLGGLISISGGAEFYRKSSSLENEETFHVIYETRSHSEVLPTRTQQDYVQVCASKDATHVVSQVLYGQRGYLSFKHKFSESSKEKNVKGHLKIVVKSLFSITGKGKVDIKNSDKRLTESTDVKISGDFILDTMPTTFKESIDTFKRLATSNGKSPRNMPVKPVRVQLTPLWKYCDKSSAILIRISGAMIDEVAKVLDKMEKLQIKANTLLSTKPCIDYQAVRKNIDIYETFLRKYQINMQGKLQAILPAIRANKGKSEADLNKLIADYLSSPIKYDKSSRFLSRRNREIRAIQYLIDHFDVNNQENVDIADYESANDVDISLRYGFVVILSVNILQPKEVTESFVKGNEVDESTFWFNDLESVGSLGNQIRQFKTFAEVNNDKNHIFYLVKITKKESTPFNVTAIKESKYKPFKIPTKPEVPGFMSKTHNSITVAVQPSNDQSIKQFYLFYWNILEGEEKAKRTNLLNLSARLATIDDLAPRNFYQYRAAYYTEFGISPLSDKSDVVMTFPTSPPANLEVSDRTGDSIQVSWKAPLIIGNNVTITGYKAVIYKYNSLVDLQHVASNVLSVTFQNLISAKKYFIKIIATTPVITISMQKGNVTKQIESNAATIRAHTFPMPPGDLMLVSTGLNSIKLTWNEPIIARQADLIGYVVRYIEMDSKGKNEIVGTEKSYSALKNLHATVSGLTQGTTYSFRVQVKTSLGSSSFSSILTARTQYDFTELDKLKQAIGTNVNRSIQAAIDVSNQGLIQNDIKNLLRVSMSSNSGLIPFGPNYGDVLQPYGDDISFKIKPNDTSFFNSFIKTVNPRATQIQVGNDGYINIGDGAYSRNPSAYRDPSICGFSDDFSTVKSINQSSVFIRYKIQTNVRSIINNDINRYLFLNDKPVTFSSQFALLVTYNNTMDHFSSKRFTFQIAVASDGTQSFAIFNYDRLDGNAGYGVGYYDPGKCGGWNYYVDKLETKDLVLTSNIGAKGKHVIPLKC